MIPIVLHKGLFGFGDLQLGPLRMSYFHKIDSAIAGRGHPLILPQVHPTGGIILRAAQLKESILQQLAASGQPDGQVVIIAHSMGGLDARYMISKLDMARHVAALVTITTPHRGSPFADWGVRHLGKRLGGLNLLRKLRIDCDAFADLTTASCRQFNDEVYDVPGVRYFSVSAARPWHRVPAFAVHSHKIVFDAEGENDALVSVQSSTWGEHLGTWPADHWHTINKRLILELKNKTGDITPYYMRVLDSLQAAGVFA